MPKIKLIREKEQINYTKYSPQFMYQIIFHPFQHKVDDQRIDEGIRGKSLETSLIITTLRIFLFFSLPPSLPSFPVFLISVLRTQPRSLDMLSKPSATHLYLQPATRTSAHF